MLLKSCVNLFAVFNNRNKIKLNSAPANADEFGVFGELKIFGFKLVARCKEITFAFAGEFGGSSRYGSVSYCKNRLFKAIGADFIGYLIPRFLAEGLEVEGGLK